jgi:hypothetical protein
VLLLGKLPLGKLGKLGKQKHRAILAVNYFLLTATATANQKK